jgi:hypothetical protein
MKIVTIQVPDDCEVKIVRKEEETKNPVIRTYQDLIDNKIELSGFYITNQSNIFSIKGKALNFNRLISSSEKVAKSMLAMAMISQLMPYYGGEITKGEWNNKDTNKYCLINFENNIEKYTVLRDNRFLAFHTEKQRDEFLKYNERLVKDYLMIE